ncbi:hypothetical protein DEO72_LG8g2164 [Vigna unguiculata]|uniref:Uncharacterized protein n=1 Tax=Vigna unguiculata TaxID=3917 RepID=A0A4D6MU37_VIGUN|nr:hypothetical protein DEO72_LG8g2164 [Vigna unguiculata]
MVGVGRISMETVTKVREDPLEEIAKSSWPTKVGYEWVVADTDNPWQYKDMKLKELSVADKEVVETLMKFTDRLPTKRHKAQLGKKNLILFQTLRKEKAKRKVELPVRPGRGKDVKKVRATLLGSGSPAGGKGLEANLIELPEIVVQRDIETNVSDTLISSIDSMDPNALWEWRSREGIGRQFDEESGSSMVGVGRISMETVTKVREDPLEEIAKSSWPTKVGYEWVVADTDNPWQYKDMKLKELSVADKEVVETLMKFTDRLPTKRHKAQLGKKNLILFQTLRKEKAVRAKAVGSTKVPNL